MSSTGREEAGTTVPLLESTSRLRADAAASRERILAAAADLREDRRLSMTGLAAAARVGRSTLYRHFPTKAALEAALAEHVEAQAAGAQAHRLPGRPGSAVPLRLDVTQVLDDVPPHLLPDQLVAEARRAAGVAVALYVVDLDGSALVRLAGSDDFPERLGAPPALGPEIVPEGLPAFYEDLRERLPRCEAAPLWLRGRVLGLLLCVGSPLTPIEDIAREGAAALALAGAYTDVVEAARRRKPTTAAAEVQLDLLPPRVARVAGGQIAGGLLPSYEVAGDWFDYVENRDGTWIAIAEAVGNGPTAAGFSAVALGALRAARRSGHDLPRTAELMDEVVRGLGGPSFVVTAVLARWHAPTGTLSWISCGHPVPRLVSPDGALEPMEGPSHPALGAAEVPPASGWTAASARLQAGDRVLLVTDGVLDRRVEGGGVFGFEGVRRAVANAPAPTAAATALAIQRAVMSCWADPLEDDATLLVLAVD